MTDADRALDVARGAIARAILGDDDGPPTTLGPIALRPHQSQAVVRIKQSLDRHGGALLADAVGLGKTYVALAVATAYTRPLVVCPAALRPMWTEAMGIARVPCDLMGLESLSRGARPAGERDLVIVDEAHHLRTPNTRRYDAVASLAMGAHVLLLSATPLHNRRADLTAVLALFAGSGAHDWTDAECARMIVRRDGLAVAERLPVLDGPHALTPAADDDCLDAICALPLPVPAADEGTAAALSAISLVHLWASSRAALVASLRRRRARAIALRAAIAGGHIPTRAELTAWPYADGALQLAFGFVTVGASDSAVDIAVLDRRLADYADAVSALLAWCAATPDPDDARADVLRAIRRERPGARIVAFSQYAETVTALARRLRAESGVAAVTANGARIASGRITRAEVLAQFAGDAPPARAIERIELLLSTDLLSEGVDLRGASAIVHLDLPWNPARLEQRVGRARRMGSRHERVSVLAFLPPAAADRMLALRARLAAKVRIANASLGGVASPLPTLEELTSASSPVGAMETLRATLLGWRDPLEATVADAVAIGFAAGPSAGWLAAVCVGGVPRLVCRVGEADPTDDPARVLQLTERLGPSRPADVAAATDAFDEVGQWLAARRLARDLGVESAAGPVRAVLDRVSGAVATSPRFKRAEMLSAAGRARGRVVTVSGVEAERQLDALARSGDASDAWLAQVSRLGRRAAIAPSRRRDGVLGLIVVRPGS